MKKILLALALVCLVSAPARAQSYCDTQTTGLLLPVNAFDTSGFQWFDCIRNSLIQISTSVPLSAPGSSATFHIVYLDTITALVSQVVFSSDVYMAMDLQLVGTLTLPDGAIVSAFINTGAVTTAKLGTDAVTTAKVIDGAITTPKLAADAVTEAKIIDGAVATAKLGIDAVRGKLSDGRPVYIEGNLGLGVASPSNILEISGITPIIKIISEPNSVTTLWLDSTNAAILRLDVIHNGVAAVVYFQVNGVNDWAFGTGFGDSAGTDNFNIANGAGTSRLILEKTGNVGISELNPDVDLEVGVAGAGTIHAANYNAHSSRDLKSHIRALTQSDKVAAYNDLKTWEQSDFKRRVMKSTYTYEVMESTYTGGIEISVAKAGKKTPVIDEKQPDERGFIAEDMSDSIKGNEPLTISWNRTIMQIGMALQVAIQKIEALEVRVDALEALH